MAAPNIVDVTTIIGKTAVQAVTDSATAIVENTAASGKVLKVNALYISNINDNFNGEITVDIFRSSTAYYVAKAIVVPQASTIDLLSKSIYLEEGDALRLTANANDYLQVVCSYEEIN